MTLVEYLESRLLELASSLELNVRLTRRHDFRRPPTGDEVLTFCITRLNDMPHEKEELQLLQQIWTQDYYAWQTSQARIAKAQTAVDVRKTGLRKKYDSQKITSHNR